MTIDHGPPREIEQQIRARGAVLDLEFARSLYMPLASSQPRDGVEIERDVAYGTDPRHRLDVYRPCGPQSAALPVLAFFHGGGFVRGDKSDRENIGLYFARQGLITVVANYRLAPMHRWPSGGEDVVAVHQWIEERIAGFGGDPAQVFLAGESAGAAHVATALLIRGLQPAEGLRVAGGVLISGVYNVHLEKLARRQFGTATPDPRNEAYFGSEFDTYPSKSIVDLVDAPPVPLMITYAELDLVQFQVEAGELFARLVARHGFDCEIHVVRGHNHHTQTYAVNSGDESLSMPMLRFIRAHCSLGTGQTERTSNAEPA